MVQSERLKNRMFFEIAPLSDKADPTIERLGAAAFRNAVRQGMPILVLLGHGCLFLAHVSLLQAQLGIARSDLG